MMLRPTAATELPYPIPIPIPSAPKDIPVPTSTSKITTTTTQSAPTAVPVKPSGSPKTRRTPSFLFDSPPVAPLAPATSNATATSSPPTKTSKSKSSRDSILASPGTSPTNINNNSNSHHRRSFFPSPTKSSFSSGGSAGGSSSGFAGGIFSLSSLLARMPGSASIIPILSPGSHHTNNRHSISGSTTVTANTRASLDNKSPTSPTSPTSLKAGINTNNNASSRKMAGGTIGRDRVPGATGMTTAEKQEAVRNAQAVLASVRNDWEWAEELRKNKRRKTDDSLATSGSSSTVVTRTSSSSATIAVADPGLGLSDDDVEEATDGDTEDDDEDEREYRSRYESESDDSRHPKAASAGTKSASRSQQPPSEVYPDDEPKSAYRFHGPDTLGVPVTKEERRARRKKELEEEMQWNEGLRIWVERRDLWTQADKNGRVPIGKSKFEDVSSSLPLIVAFNGSKSLFNRARVALRREVLTRSLVFDPAAGSLVQNPFYHAIVPDAYPQLYSRIIIKSNTPTIPINLQHMTNALVEGWKADGQWPPKPTRPEPSMTRKKNLSLGESMVKRVFGLGR